MLSWLSVGVVLTLKIAGLFLKLRDFITVAETVLLGKGAFALGLERDGAFGRFGSRAPWARRCLVESPLPDETTSSAELVIFVSVCEGRRGIIMELPLLENFLTGRAGAEEIGRGRGCAEIDSSSGEEGSEKSDVGEAGGTAWPSTPFLS